ncbi:MAG: hypothetical protein AAFR13_00570 [Pseudomonadota bacterium]
MAGRSLFFLIGTACVAGFIASGSTATVSVGPIPEFAELTLGATQTDAIAAMSKHVSRPNVGHVCNGEYGVSAHVPYRDQSWQLMAHIHDGTVDEIRLFRSTRNEIDTHADCRTAFETVLSEWQGRSDLKNWSVDTGVLNSEKAFAASATAIGADRIAYTLTADRSVRNRALCALELIFTEAPTAALVR